MTTEMFTVEIDQLPAERFEAGSPQEAARVVGEMIANRDALRRLHDEEPVQIKRSDGRAWGRNLTLGAFRRGEIAANDGSTDGPVHPPSV